MDAAGIFLGAILIGGGIAIATGLVAVMGVLQVLRRAGLAHAPPLAAARIIARQQAVDARLRARYLARRAPRPEPVSVVIPDILAEPTVLPSPSAPTADTTFVGPLADGLPG